MGAGSWVPTSELRTSCTCLASSLGAPVGLATPKLPLVALPFSAAAVSPSDMLIKSPCAQNQSGMLACSAAGEWDELVSWGKDRGAQSREIKDALRMTSVHISRARQKLAEEGQKEHELGTLNPYRYPGWWRAPLVAARGLKRLVCMQLSSIIGVNRVPSPTPTSPSNVKIVDRPSLPSLHCGDPVCSSQGACRSRILHLSIPRRRRHCFDIS